MLLSWVCAPGLKSRTRTQSRTRTLNSPNINLTLTRLEAFDIFYDIAIW